MCLSANIRKLRKDRGWSQDELAAKLGYKSFTTIQKWERAQSEPPIKKLKMLADLFKIDINCLINSDLSPDNTPIMNNFNEALSYLRKRDGLSQVELAQKLGLCRSAISMYEKGNRTPDLDLLKKIAEFFNVDMNFISAYGQWKSENKSDHVEENQRRIFSSNLKNILAEHSKSQSEVAAAIAVSPQTFNTWTQGIAIPRIGSMQKLADYFNVSKSYFIDDHSSGKDNDTEEICRCRIISLIETQCNGSQQAFADKVGIGKASVSQYVNGTNSPGKMTTQKIASAFGVNLVWMMGYDAPMYIEYNDNNPYNFDQAARDVADFLFYNPSYKVLFDSIRKVKPENIDKVRKMIDLMLD